MEAPLQLELRHMQPRLPSRAEQERRWRELDARRPHARYLSIAERIEFDRLDSARSQRLARIG